MANYPELDDELDDEDIGLGAGWLMPLDLRALLFLFTIVAFVAGMCFIPAIISAIMGAFSAVYLQ